jgi:hypothetical protein
MNPPRASRIHPPFPAARNFCPLRVPDGDTRPLFIYKMELKG